MTHKVSNTIIWKKKHGKIVLIIFDNIYLCLKILARTDLYDDLRTCYARPDLVEEYRIKLSDFQK